ARLDWRRRCQARRSDRAVARFRSPAELFAVRLAVRRSADRAADPVPRPSDAAPARKSGVGGAAAPQGRRRALWHPTRRRGAARLSRYAVDEGDRDVASRAASRPHQSRNHLLTRFGYASLTML